MDQKEGFLDQRKLIKFDINSLGFPSWTLNERSKRRVLTIERENGTYSIESLRPFPNHFDQSVMKVIQYKFFNEVKDGSLELHTTRYEIAKIMMRGAKIAGEKIFIRIMQALEKLKYLQISFKGTFYTGNGYTERYFSQINDIIYAPAKTKNLCIIFNKQYISIQRETEYYKWIDIDVDLSLKRAASKRLYEILCTSFLERDTWAISIDYLAEKMAAEKRTGAKHYYPSDILAIIKPAIKEINEKTNLGIQFDYYKSNSVCSFKKIKKLESKIIPAKKIQEQPQENDKVSHSANLVRECMNHFHSLPAESQLKILDGIKRDSIIKSHPELSYQIYAYMDKYKLWQPHLHEQL